MTPDPVLRQHLLTLEAHAKVTLMQQMEQLALVGDIGGTNSRFGLLKPGSHHLHDIAVLRNDEFQSLEAVLQAYLVPRAIKSLSALCLAIAGPIAGEPIALTNRAWSFTRASLQKTTGSADVLLLNDFEALAWSLPFIQPDDLLQIGGADQLQRGLKIVIGPGTGLGMAMLAPLEPEGWMALAGEVGHTTLPISNADEFELLKAMQQPGVLFESEDAITGTGLPRIYTAVARLAGLPAKLSRPEDILAAGLARTDPVAEKTLAHFVHWLALMAGDAAMTVQARGGVYLCSNICTTLKDYLVQSDFRTVFQEKGRLAAFMRPIPIFLVLAEFPALTGCAAALAARIIQAEGVRAP